LRSAHRSISSLASTTVIVGLDEAKLTVLSEGRAQRGTIGSLGGFFGPFLVGWIKDATGSFILGLVAMAVILAVTTALSTALRFVVRQD
jgi:cyanate permease